MLVIGFAAPLVTLDWRGVAREAGVHDLLGGRPMTYVGYLENDDAPVEYYLDAFGRLWLASGPWALLRRRAALI